jgi:hypothetical protein
VNNFLSTPDYNFVNLFIAGDGAGLGGAGGLSLGDSGSDGSAGASGDTNL